MCEQKLMNFALYELSTLILKACAKHIFAFHCILHLSNCKVRKIENVSFSQHTSIFNSGDIHFIFLSNS